MNGLYYVTLGTASTIVAGCEAAYDLFRKACEVGSYFGKLVCLCDCDTGEVIADNMEEEG